MSDLRRYATFYARGRKLNFCVYCLSVTRNATMQCLVGLETTELDIIARGVIYFPDLYFVFLGKGK